MGPSIFILAIMGCGEAEAPCEQVAIAPVRYESAQACDAQSAIQVERYQDIDYPVVVAECRQADAKVAAQLKADEVKLPEPSRPAAVRPAIYKPGERIRT